MNKISALSSDVHCHACDGTGIFLPIEFLELEKDIASILSEFPLPDIMGKGQWFFKPKTIARLLAYLYQKHDIEGKTIGCLASPTIAAGLSLLKEKANLHINVLVLDIDADILELLSRRFQSIEAHIYDIGNKCPEELRGRCDSFVFDPLYSMDHYKIGLSRCVQLIGSNHPDRSGYIIVPPEEIAPIKTVRGGKNVPLQLAVFGYLNEMGLCIADFKDNFIEYSTPPAEAGILRTRSGSLFERYTLDEWRGSDLVRVISTSETIPLVQDDSPLSKKVNNSRRIGVGKNLIQLDELSSDSLCTICSRCFTTHYENQKIKKYTSYWKPEVIIRNMPSWRASDDQPFEVARSCAGFENTQNGELTILRGPAAKVIWEIMRDLESELDDNVQLDAIIERSLPDFYDLDMDQVRGEVKEFVREIMRIGLTKERNIT